jgi:hypothetical protein
MRYALILRSTETNAILVAFDAVPGSPLIVQTGAWNAVAVPRQLFQFRPDTFDMPL